MVSVSPSDRQTSPKRYAISTFMQVIETKITDLAEATVNRGGSNDYPQSVLEQK